jgi:carboxymethylenebutenolidase
MCDQDHFDEDLKKYTRRDVGVLAAAVGVTAMLPRASNAVDVKEKDVNIKTPDGECDAYFVAPSSGASAAVLVWPDIFGLRPAFRQMGKRLAESGYAVLVVNPFYRSKHAPVVPDGASFADQKVRDAVLPLAQALNATTHTTDARAFVAWLDTQQAVDKSKKIGTTGYCMGGPITMRTAAAVPERVGAGASFHGGGLATNAPDSPHLLVPKIKAQFLFAIADNDDMRDPDAKNLLRDAFAKTGVPAEIEVYKGAMHGWCALDATVYDKEKAERAWSRLLELFEKALA